MNTRFVIAFSIVLALAIGFGYGAFVTRPARLPEGVVTRLNAATVLPSPQVLPAFALHDEDGAPFGPAQLAGEWSLIFFGFTSCGDVCPTTLHTLVEAVAHIPVKPRIIFLSVDPGRDTAGVLASYVSGFDAHLRGVTGDDAEIRKLSSALGVSYALVPAPGPAGGSTPGAYRVEHSSAVFVTDRDGRYVAVFTSPSDAALIATDLRTIIGT